MHPSHIIFLHVPHTADSGQQMGQNTSLHEVHKKHEISLFVSQKHIYKIDSKYKKNHFIVFINLSISKLLLLLRLLLGILLLGLLLGILLDTFLFL